MCEARRRSPIWKVDDNIVLLCRETRDGNNLYQELSFTDNDALADIDEGADLTGGTSCSMPHIIGGVNILININVTFSAAEGGWVHPSEFASSGQ